MFARDAGALADHLGIASAVWVGLSLGSAIIQELALTRPRLVRRAVLLSTWSSTRRQNHIRRWFEARLLALEKAPADVFQAFSFWMWAPSVIDCEPQLASEIERIFASNSAAQPLHAYAQHFRADLGHDTHDRLGDIGCPVLVVYGSEDLITLPWYNRSVADSIPGARCLEIEKAGHFLWLERPLEVNAAISAFLSEDGRA
jgi:pimeloyl-ACP methyl ester carboxylesterase